MKIMGIPLCTNESAPPPPTRTTLDPISGVHIVFQLCNPKIYFFLEVSDIKVPFYNQVNLEFSKTGKF